MPDFNIDEETAEPETHSFIVKVWLDDPLQDVEPPTFRGHITHVRSGLRKYFKSFDEMRYFIQRHFSRLSKGND